MTSRKLTQGEIALAQKVFKDAIDYSSVLIHNGKHNPLQSDNTVIAPNGEVYIPNPSLYQTDYSITPNPRLKSLFIHEMVHVWQYQNKVLDPLVAAAVEMLRHFGQYHKAYEYTLDERKDLLDYRIEQQAAIIEDYFRAQYLGMQPLRPPTGRNIQNLLPPSERMAAFRRVLMNFVANPNYANKNMKCMKTKLPLSRGTLTCTGK